MPRTAVYPTRQLNRRSFLTVAGTLVSGAALGQTPIASSGLSVGQVLARIKEHIGVPWPDDPAKTVDNLLTGTPQTLVRGIATTMMATLEVVENCVAARKNLILSHETPFYMHQDQTADIANDATLRYKLDYCKQHDVAILHFHDYWHRRQPDGIAQGMVEQLGWQKNVVDRANPARLAFPGTTLAALAREIQTKLGATTLRVVGDPNLPVRNVQANWGYTGREGGIKVIQQPDVDLLICGETREWELVEYVQDCIVAGQKKAMIVVGHVLSEQGGMILCASWLRTFITEVPIQFVPAPEPFWNPAEKLRG